MLSAVENAEKILENLEIKLEILLELKKEAEELLVQEKSIEFIQDNRISIHDVQRDDEPWEFTYLGAFALWLQDNCEKKWCVWDSKIYKTEDLINRIALTKGSPGRYEDLEALNT